MTTQPLHVLDARSIAGTRKVGDTLVLFGPDAGHEALAR